MGDDYDNYYNDPEIEARGIDWDLIGCLRYNPQAFSITDIQRVLAVWQGESAGDDWRWVLLLRDGRYAFLQGGCDYTGWGCQCSAASSVHATPEEAALQALNDDNWRGNKEAVKADLLQQIIDGKKQQTWTEQMNEEFGL